mmetsp:Transcript_2922/g.3382  ORF Transcript_2922/g.3382 Transcript_2922/m.3382 type:complete len:292 (-) Transcript_2922:265-1140(-)
MELAQQRRQVLHSGCEDKVAELIVVGQPRDVCVHKDGDETSLDGLHEVERRAAEAAGHEAESGGEHDVAPAPSVVEQDLVREVPGDCKAVHCILHSLSHPVRCVPNGTDVRDEVPALLQRRPLALQLQGVIIRLTGVIERWPKRIHQGDWDMAVAASAEDEDVGIFSQVDLGLASEAFVILAHRNVGHILSYDLLECLNEGCGVPKSGYVVVKPWIHPCREDWNVRPKQVMQARAIGAGLPLPQELGHPHVFDVVGMNKALEEGPKGLADLLHVLLCILRILEPHRRRSLL